MKTLEITNWEFPQDSLDHFTVTYRVTDDVVPYVSGPFTKEYSQWDTSKTLVETKQLVQADLEGDNGI